MPENYLPLNYYRIDLRIPPEMSEELEKLQVELLDKTGKKMSKSSIINMMIREFLEKPSSSCVLKKKKT